MGKSRFWTNEEEEYLISNLGALSVKELSDDLNRTERSIYKKVFKLRKEGRFDDLPSGIDTELDNFTY